VGLLDDLKKQADALKAQDTDKTESLRTTAVAVDHALRRSFLYLNDLGKQLNVVQMPSPFTFDLPTVGKIDGLVIKARQVADLAQRKQLYDKATELLLRDVPALHLWHRRIFTGLSARVQGFTPHPDGIIRVKGLRF